jgi:DNA-binding winged helix-turn-helix (wHTH) protein/tetratricopeptide (TPR) repeat protein
VTRQSASNHPYRFGEFVLDPAARELRFKGEQLAPSMKVFDCIAYLIENRDRAVSRDELIAAIWGKVDIEYTVLGQLMAKVRRTIGHSGHDQDSIRTIPRFGYRWVAPITSHEGSTGALHVEPQIESPSPTAPPGVALRSRRPGLLVLTGLLLLAAAVMLWVFLPVNRRLEPADPAPLATYVAAILPVEVVADEESAWVRLGMMDWIGERMRKNGQTVVPSDNVVRLSRGDSKVSLDKAVREVTGARYVVMPRAERNADGWLLTLRLQSSDSEDFTVQARSKDIIEACGRASDLILERLGRKPAPARSGSGDESGDELLARAKAALFAGELDAARKILESAPADVQQSPAFRRRLSQVDYRSGQLQKASNRLEDLLKELGPEAEPRLRAGALSDAGTVAIYQENAKLAKQRFDDAIELLADGDYPSELARAYTGAGIARALQGDYAAARLEFSKAGVAAAVTGDAGSQATVDLDVGALEIEQGHFAEASVVMQRAADRFRLLLMRDEWLNTEAARMDIALTLLEPSEALEIGTRMRPVLETVQNARTRRQFLFQWARTMAALGRLSEATETFADLARVSVPQEDSAMFPASVSGEESALNLAAGDFESALVKAARAVEALTSPTYVRDRSRAWLTAIRTLRALGRSSEADVQIEQFSAWASNASRPSVTLRVEVIEAEGAWRLAQRDEARRLYESALARALETDIPADIAEVAQSYGNNLLTAGDFERASAVIGLLAKFADRDFDSSVLLARLHQALGQRGLRQVTVQQARTLAGERDLPRELEAPPPERLSGGPGAR